MKNLIIYHSADFDGILSREVCLYFLGHDTEAAGWDYGQPVPATRDPLDTYDKIYMVDISVEKLLDDPALEKKIIWIDHHKSAIDRWPNKFPGLQRDGTAACELCWDYFNDGKDFPVLPELIRLASIYDVWKKDHPDFDRAKNLQFGLRAIGQDQFNGLVHYQLACGPEADVNRLYLNPVIELGVSIRNYCQKQNDEYSKAYAHTIEWEGLKFCALNIGQRGNSDLLLGGILPEHDACFAWRWDGKEVMVSLYHIAGKEHHDLSLIAKKYGGGGHRGACGFRINLVKLEKILLPF